MTARTRGVVVAFAATALLILPMAPITGQAVRANTDTTPPSAPQGLTGLAEPDRYVQLSWRPSSDDSGGPIRYRVTRNETTIGGRTAATGYIDRPDIAGTYLYKVRAIDAAGNKSAFSPAVSVTAVITFADTSPPSVPQGLTGTPEADRHVRLSWQPSKDNAAGKVKYRVFRNDVAIGTKIAATDYLDRPPRQGTYRYKVRAIDVAGNKSPHSYTIRRTATNGPPDETSPSTPFGLQAGVLSEGQAALSWQPSSDDRVGKIWYHVIRNGMRIATLTSTSYTDWRGGLKAASQSYEIEAVDGAGNVSEPSAMVEVEAGPELFPWAAIQYRAGSRLEPVVALTFDDGLRSENMRRIADTLRAHDAPGTFFPTGAAIDRDPALWADIARDFPVGNHTYTHPNLSQATPEVIESELVRATQRIESATGRSMIPIMRPPGGYNNLKVRGVVQTLGLAIALWDVDTRDWENSPPAEIVRGRALTATNGSIILLHDGANTVKALPEIITGLRAMGFRLVSLDEMLGIPWLPAHR
jgi:peptidoglycan/xylan/chitin deacetylase (PgdA/CDA1 family)